MSFNIQVVFQNPWTGTETAGCLYRYPVESGFGQGSKVLNVLQQATEVKMHLFEMQFSGLKYYSGDFHVSNVCLLDSQITSKWPI